MEDEMDVAAEEGNFSTAKSSLDLDGELNEPKEKEEETINLAEEERKTKNVENDFFDENLIKKSPVEGELDEDTVYENISCIQKSNHGALQNLTFSGSNLNLKDISILAKYSHLQSVDVSNNQITDLSALDNLNCLLILNASHNQIKKLLDFKSPKNLKHVDFSHNEIEEISDLSAHHYLSELYLDHNKIRQIHGVSQCHRLGRLSLSHNEISKIKNIDSLPLMFLNLSYNHIYKIENLEDLYWLREIDLSHNLIHSLKGLEKHHLLESINVNDNRIQYIEEISHIKELSMLRNFTIMRNPVGNMFNYELAILFQIQQLLELNGSPVSIKSKVEARNLFDPSLEVVAAKTHMMLTYYSFLKPIRIMDVTMSNINEPYPMLVLVGIDGCGNKKLAMNIAQAFSKNLRYGVLEITRPMLRGEMEGRDYYFTTLNNFQKKVLNGEFIVTSQFKGNYYGLKSITLEHIAEEGKGCIAHLQLEAMLTLKYSHFQPRFILTVHSTRQAQKKHMQATGLYTDEDIEQALLNWDALVEYNQQHPGAFFIVIITDNMQLADERLHQLVKSWISGSEKLPKFSPIGFQDEKELNATPRQTSVIDQPLYTAPMIGIVEEESLKRRYQAVKKIVQAYVPPLYDQITRSNSSGSASFKHSDQRPHSRPSLNEPISDDSSIDLVISAKSGKKSGPDEGDLNKSGSGDRLVLSSHSDDTDDSDFNLKEKTFTITPIPPAARRPMSGGSSKRYTRLGSAKHIVVPPIAPTENEK